MTELSISPLILEAKAGVGTSIGSLLEVYRSYLKLLARVQLERRYRVSDASDLVQEAFLRANRAFHQFQGTTEAELTAWLRQILARCLVDWHRSQKHRLSEANNSVLAISVDLDHTSACLAGQLVSPHDSPSATAQRRESAVVLAQALNRLPADYREAIVLRQLEELSSEEVARRMGRSVNSVRKLWARGMVELREILLEYS